MYLYFKSYLHKNVLLETSNIFELKNNILTYLEYKNTNSLLTVQMAGVINFQQYFI